MKQLLLFTLALIVTISCNNNKGPRDLVNEGGGGADGWTTALKNKYLKQCVDEVGDKEICSCVLNKVVKKYTPEEAKELSNDVGTKLAKECQQGNTGTTDDEDDNGFKKKKKTTIDDEDGPVAQDGWTKKDRNTFLSQCEQALVTKGYTSKQASQMCECALGKLEQKYSSLAEGNTIGGEAAGTKAMQQCVAEGGNSNENDN